MHRIKLSALLIIMTALASGGLVRPASAERNSLDRYQVWRDLLAESSRAELDRGGLFIDFGTADQDKYTRGGWRTGWSERRVAKDGVGYAALEKREAQLSMLLQGTAREVVVRARAESGSSSLGVVFDGERMSLAAGSSTSVRVDETWRTFHFRAPEGVAPGRHGVALTSSARSRRLVEVDWVWVRTSGGATPPAVGPRVGPLRVGDRPRRALLAPGSSRYSFYLHVPTRGVLTFDYGASDETRFIVRVQNEKGVTKELFNKPAKAGQWQRGSVDLRAYGKRAVRLELATEGSSESAGWGQPNILVPPREYARRGRRGAGRGPRNVLLVVYDTTRADVFSKFREPDREGPVIAPNYEKLSKKATTFVRAYNNESWTRPSTISILTGLYPSTHGALYAKSVLDEGVELISEHLHDNGFQTIGIVGNSVLGPAFGLDQGWDEYREYGHEDNSAPRIFGEAIEWVEKNHRKKPFFMYIQSHDSHTPYDVDPKYIEPFHPESYSGRLGQSISDDEVKALDKGKLRASGRDKKWIEAVYHGEARYQDEYFGRLIERMRQLDILDDTLIVVTNDHGEELGEHKSWGHAWTLYDQLLRAPLLIYNPGVMPAGREIVEPVEHVDVAPTIVDILGLPPMGDADGMSLMALLDGRGMRPRPFYTVSELRKTARAIHVGRWKLIVDKDKGWEDLYDIESDPHEQRSRLQDRPIAGRLCEIYLGEALASPKKSQRMHNMTTRRQYRTRAAKLDAKTKRSLEALGYLGQDGAIEEEPDADD